MSRASLRSRYDESQTNRAQTELELHSTTTIIITLIVGLALDLPPVRAQSNAPSSHLQTLEQSAKAHPKDSNAHAKLGAELYRLGKVKEALEEQKKAVQLNPKNVEAHQQLGMAFLYLGMTHEAREEMRNAALLKGGKKCRCGSLEAALNKALKKYAEQYQGKARG